MVESSEIVCRGRGHFAKQVFQIVTIASSSIFSEKKNCSMTFRTYFTQNWLLWHNATATRSLLL